MVSLEKVAWSRVEGQELEQMQELALLWHCQPLKVIAKKCVPMDNEGHLNLATHSSRENAGPC